LVVGTDKGDSTGGLYVFTLDGRIDSSRTRRPLKRPNNVDVITGVALNGALIDVAVTAERGTMALRIFRLPDSRLAEQFPGAAWDPSLDGLVRSG
jgi:3-phytase